MLKFIKHHIETIDGVEIYPVISLLIFFGFFACLFFWVFTSKKQYLDTVSNLPFEADINNKNDKL